VARRLFGQRVLYVVDDEMGGHVEEDETLADEAVFQFFRQLWQRREHLRRHGGERDGVGVPAVHAQLNRSRILVHDRGFELSSLGPGQRTLQLTPEEIDKHQRALAQAIEQMRSSAKPGDIFTRDVRAYLRRQLERVFAGPEGRKLKATIMDENPGPIRLRVNGRYPDTVPLATMPPQVLAALPKMPEELEYRFIGERLILLDVPAHLVVDFIEDALPR